MVHSCVVQGCNNRSNKEDCKGVKFYTLHFKNECLLETWLTLICRRRGEVNVHSRICSVHFIDGVKKSSKDLPQIFPWQKYTSCTSTLVSENQTKNPPSPSQIVYHDHCYWSPHYLSLSPVTRDSSYLTPITASDILVYRIMHQLLPTLLSSHQRPCPLTFL